MRTPEELSREFEPTAQSIANRGRQAEREELIRPRRENQRRRQERDILSNAAAWFARERKASPNRFYQF